MLRNTFLHVPGVGEKTERKLWENGIHTWDDYLDGGRPADAIGGRRERVTEHIRRSVRCLKEGEYGFLRDKLPSCAHWRAYREMAKEKKCCFLDIETTGLSQQMHDITMIGVYDGSGSRVFVRDKNLGDFEREIKKYDLLVTFNGKCFDVPFIQSEFSDIEFDKFHVDLRYEMKKLGYTGGLKRIENALGISRPEGVEGMDGREAVLLWKRYRSGERKALEKLVDYNRQDTENLKAVMEFAYRKLRERNFGRNSSRFK